MAPDTSETRDAEGPVDRIGRLARWVNTQRRRLRQQDDAAASQHAQPRGAASEPEPGAGQNTNDSDPSQAADQPLQQQMGRRAVDLNKRWNQWFEAPAELADARTLVRDTRDYLRWVPEQMSVAGEQGMPSAAEQRARDRSTVPPEVIELIGDIEQQLLDILLAHAQNASAPASVNRVPETDLARTGQDRAAGSDRASPDRIAELLTALGY